ncbi:MAG: ParB/RepB/Spo0J family partition protein [Oscillospiraceae bacterium]
MAILFHKKPTLSVMEIPVDNIIPNPSQPRMVFEQQALEQLAQSIAQNGLLQPITVRDLGRDTYELVAGERRLRAVKLLKLQTITAIVKEIEQNGSSIFALIENIQRENLSYFEEALAYQKLLEVLGESQQQLAARLGKNQSTIANKLRLLKITPEMAQKILSYQLTERHARALLSVIHLPNIEKIIDYVGENGLNVSQTEVYIKKLLEEQTPQNKNLIIVKDVRIFLNSIQKAIDVMKQSGICAASTKREDDNTITYTVTIPKNNVYKQETITQASN